jgi:hypothetical protein
MNMTRTIDSLVATAHYCGGLALMPTQASVYPQMNDGDAHGASGWRMECLRFGQWGRGGELCYVQLLAADVPVFGFEMSVI